MNLPKAFLNNLFVIAGPAPLEILKNLWFSTRSRRKSATPYFVFNKETSAGSLTGFTLIEFLIVTGLIILLAGLLVPVGFSFYRTQSVDEAREDIITILRRAQNQALFQKNDSAFGIKFLSDSYALFQGSSYAARQQSEDEIFIIPSGIAITGLGEVVFNKFTGVPGIVGIVSVSSGSYTKSIDINAQGKIEGL